MESYTLLTFIMAIITFPAIIVLALGVVLPWLEPADKDQDQ